METSAKHSVTSEVQTVSESEMQAISGGLSYTSVSGMPDRSEMCGTMWYQQQLLRIILGFPR